MIIVPQRISIEICTTCNLACKMCFLTGFKERKIIKESDYLNKFFDVDLFKKLIDELTTEASLERGSTPFSLIFTGGEPLLHPKIFELLAYARSKGAGITLFTNGTLINPEIAEKIVQAKPEALMFSVEGPEQIHNEIRGEGNFKKTYDAINLIQSQKKLLGLNKPRIFINTVMNSSNIKYLLDVISLAESLHIDGISFSHIQWSNQELNALAKDEFKQRLRWFSPLSKMIEAVENNLIIKNEEVRELIDQIELIKKKREYHSFQISLMPDLNHEEIQLWYARKYGKVNRCSSVFNWIRIGVNGDIQPICAVIPFSFGNLKEQALKEILSGERIKSFFKEIENNGYFYACQRCCRRAKESLSVLTT